MYVPAIQREERVREWEWGGIVAVGEMDPNRTTTKKSGPPPIYSLYEDTTLCGCWLRVDGIPV
jgi:hypothetical protein